MFRIFFSIFKYSILLLLFLVCFVFIKPPCLFQGPFKMLSTTLWNCIDLGLNPEKAMVTHSTTLAWKIPWMEEPGRLQSMGSRSRARLSDFAFTFHFPALEKEMATHSSVLAWRIPGMGEPGGLLSLGSHRVRHDWSNLAAAGLNPAGTTLVTDLGQII